MIDVQMGQENRIELCKRQSRFSKPGKRPRTRIDEDARGPVDEHDVRG